MELYEENPFMEPLSPIESYTELLESVGSYTELLNCSESSINEFTASNNAEIDFEVNPEPPAKKSNHQKNISWLIYLRRS